MTRKLVGIVSLFVLAGCTSLQNPSSMEALKAVEAVSSPFVEAFVEFAGPDARWAGPASLVVRVDTRQSAVAHVTSQPAVRAMAHPPADGTTAGRGLASEPGMPTPKARALFSELATQMQADAQSFSGCLYPVRVRLIRQDGSVLEKHGCRSHQGWPQAVSKAVSTFLAS